jgi:hypothetical protein
MRSYFLVALGVLMLGGCVFVPVEPPYAGPAQAPVVVGPPVMVAPAPYYYPYGYGHPYPYPYRYGYRRW